MKVNQSVLEDGFFIFGNSLMGSHWRSTISYPSQGFFPKSKSSWLEFTGYNKLITFHNKLPVYMAIGYGNNIWCMGICISWKHSHLDQCCRSWRHFNQFLEYSRRITMILICCTEILPSVRFSRHQLCSIRPENLRYKVEMNVVNTTE